MATLKLDTHQFHTAIGTFEGKMSSDMIIRDIKETVAELGVEMIFDYGVLKTRN